MEMELKLELPRSSTSLLEPPRAWTATTWCEDAEFAAFWWILELHLGWLERTP